MTNTNTGALKPRYHVLDILRGISIIYVVFYHAVFNVSLYSEDAARLLYSNGMIYSRIFFVGILVFISGISSYLTRSNVKRGIKTCLAALAVTLVTAVATPSMVIIFGILHFFGSAMLIFSLIRKPLEKIPWYISLPAFILLFICTYDIYHVVGIVPKSYILFILGFETGHSSGDYYPLIPHIFLFLAGTVAGRAFKGNRVPKLLTANFAPPLAAVGRHTLLIYLAHQPILFALTYVIYNYIYI